MRAGSVPAPTIHALHLGDDGVEFLASDFVVGDGSAPDSHVFGAQLRAIHKLPPTFPLVEAGDTPPHERIAARLSERTAALARLTGEGFPLPDRHELARLLAPRAAARALLHMDAPPATLFTRQGAIGAIVDWGNALVGDPALELARIADERLSGGYVPSRLWW